MHEASREAFMSCLESKKLYRKSSKLCVESGVLTHCSNELIRQSRMLIEDLRQDMRRRRQNEPGAEPYFDHAAARDIRLPVTGFAIGRADVNPSLHGSFSSRDASPFHAHRLQVGAELLLTIEVQKLPAAMYTGCLPCEPREQPA